MKIKFALTAILTIFCLLSINAQTTATEKKEMKVKLDKAEKVCVAKGEKLLKLANKPERAKSAAENHCETKRKEAELLDDLSKKTEYRKDYIKKHSGKEN